MTLLSMAVYDTAGSVQVMTPSDFSPSAHEITSGGQVISPSADVFLLLYMGSFLTLGGPINAPSGDVLPLLYEAGDVPVIAPSVTNFSYLRHETTADVPVKPLQIDISFFCGYAMVQ